MIADPRRHAVAATSTGQPDSWPSARGVLPLRRARPADAGAIWGLAVPYVPTDRQLTGVEAEILRRQISHGAVIGAVAERPQRPLLFGWTLPSHIVGGVVIKPADGYIWMLYVDKRWQRRGIGRALLEAALDIMRRDGHAAATLRVPTGAPAEGFYRHLGWQRMHKAMGDRHEIYRFDFPAIGP